MWTISLIIQAIAWTVLIACSPLIFIYIRKVAKYSAYKIFPKDTILQFTANGHTEKAFHVTMRPLGKTTIRELSKKEIAELEGRT